MPEPAIVLRVKFKSKLSLEEVTGIIESRADDFRALPGLQQKYYLLDRNTGEFGGLYLWESRAAFDEYLQSELRATIAEAYQTEGPPQVEVFEVIKTLRPASSQTS